jgi:phospholipase/carboxylesterase
MLNRPLTRRQAAIELAAFGAWLGFGCTPGQSQDRPASRSGRLTARPRADVVAGATGLSPLGLGGDRDGLLFVPPVTGGRVPLVLLLHGAGGAAHTFWSRLSGVAERVGCAIVVPESRGPTWDAIRDGFGPDVEFIDSAMRLAMSRVAVDPARVVASGFSDGASYALALGLNNGDLFTRVMAFSPGFIPPGGARHGSPEVFMTHGDQDPILPYEATSRRIVASLERAGYSVTFRKFTGGHTVPADLARDGFTWATRAARANGRG